MPKKTDAIRICIQAQHGKEDYAEARSELRALLSRIDELESSLNKCREAFRHDAPRTREFLDELDRVLDSEGEKA